MGYLICDKCQGYYELQPGESPDDFLKCECGGNLKYIEKEEINKEEPKVKEDAKKEDSDKYCPTCGQPLPSSKKSKAPKIDTSKQKKAAKKAASKFAGSSKERFMGLSTRNKAFSIGGILIVLILIGVFAFPGNIAAAQYEKNNVSFDYPNNWNITSVYEEQKMVGNLTSTQLDINGPQINVGTIDIYTLDKELLASIKAEEKNPQNLNGYTYYETISSGTNNHRALGIILDEKNMKGCKILIAGKSDQVEDGFKMIVNSFKFN